MTRLTALLLSVLFLAAAPLARAGGCPFASPSGYTLTIPLGWGIVSPGGGIDVKFVAPQKAGPADATQPATPRTCVVTVVPAPDGTPKDALKAYLDQAVAAYQRAFSNFKVADSGSTSLGYDAAAYFKATVQPTGVTEPLEFRTTVAIHGKTLFSITSTASAKEYPDFEPGVLSIESSFTISPFDKRAFTSEYGFQMTPPDGWKVQKEPSLPDIVTFIENVPDGDFPANILVRARTGLGADVDFDRVWSLRDQWNNKYRQLPGYAPADQGMIVVGGEKALYTVWVQDGTNPPKKMREWHVMLPRNGVLIEFVGTCLQSDHVRYDRIIRDTVRSWVWTPPAPPTAAVAPVVPPAPQDPAK